MPLITLNGALDAFFETGTEGIVWSFIEQGREGSYEGLHPLKDGDILKVFADQARVTTQWSGTVKLEYKRNWQSFPLNPEYGQQAVDGMWVHGLQEDLAPEAWSSMFHQTLPAQLTFAASQQSSAFEGRLGKFMVPDMQAPQWVLKKGYDTRLENGDELTVFRDADQHEVLWQGTLAFEEISQRMSYVLPPQGQVTTPEDIRAHLFPKNIDPDMWENFIENKHPARLVRRFWARDPG